MKITSAELIISAIRRSQYPTDNLPEFMLVGRSNVGKSSFINLIANNKKLARISSTPGKTRNLNFYLFNKKFYFVDVPGYGYANVSKREQKKFGLMIEEYLEKRENLKMTFMLVDSRHKPTEDDLLMYRFLKYYNLPVTIIATKTDKLSGTKKDKSKKIILETLNLEKDDNLIMISNITKEGRENRSIYRWKAYQTCNRRWYRRVDRDR